MNKRITYSIAIFLLFVYVAMSCSSAYARGGWLLMLFFINLGIIFIQSLKLKGFTFTIMIFGVVSLAIYYPQYFVQIGGFQL